MTVTGLRAGVNRREQLSEYLTRLRLKDRDSDLLHTRDGEEGPLERGFTSATSHWQEDFKGWVVGFHGEQSDELTKLPMMLADAQVARWQSTYGRDHTDQQRSSRWLVNKIRTDSDMAMMGIT